MSLKRLPLTFIFLLVLLIQNQKAYNQGIKYDTILIKGGNTVILDDTTFYLAHDSLFIVPDSVDILTGKSGKQFFKNLAKSAKKNKLTRELYRLAFSAPKRTSTTTAITKAETPYLPFSGKIIRHINIKNLQIFGPTIADTNRKAVTWIGKTANALHNKTRQWVIKQNLLFKPGDELNPYLMAENASIIRRLRYIDDAALIIKDVGKDSVDIQVITKDFFPLSIQPDIHNSHSIYLKGSSVNLLGLGVGFEHAISVDTKRDEAFRYDLGDVQINNILGSFINGGVAYHHKDDSLVQAVSLNRSIIPLKFNYFGGIKYYTGEWYFPYFNQDSLLHTQSVFFNEFDLYAGRSFINRKYKNKNAGTPIIKTISARYQLLDYHNRPLVTRDSNFRIQKATNLFASVCISKQDYFNTSFFYEFGRTEDIPYGFRSLFVGGYQFGEFFNRTYLGTSVSAANVYPNVGYLFGEINFGGYVHNDKFEQGVFKVKGIYATNSIRLNRSRLRFYVKSTYTLGVNRLKSDTLYIEDIHGFPSSYDDLLYGTKRFTVSPELNVFTPWYFYGFRFSIFGFSDLAWIGNSNKMVFENPTRLYLGSGMRIKNENLILDTFEFRLSYFVNAPRGKNPLIIEIGTVQSLRFPQFLPGKPSKIKFK